MFIPFDVLTFLFWMIVTTFIPGAIIGLSIFRKDDFLLIEKLMIGFTIGFILLPMPPFLLFLFLGIKYTFTIAIASIAVIYIVALAFLVWSKLYEDVKSIKLNELIPKQLTFSQSAIISISMLVILLLTYLIRIGSYSPIFQELDPYFYTYMSTQILSQGGNFFNDSTAWFSYGTDGAVVNHRGIPGISYLESIWYSVYTHGAPYNNMTLALVASMYPPIAAVIAVFFVYMLISASSKREWGVITSALVSFAPILVYKLSAGEQQAVPYTFLGLAFFYAMYALSMKRKDIRFPILAGLGYFAILLNSPADILSIVAVMIFMGAQSVLLFARDEDESSLLDFLKVNGVILIIGALLASVLLFFFQGTLDMFKNAAVPFIVFMVFIGLLYLIKKSLRDGTLASKIRLGIMSLVSLFVLALVAITLYNSFSGKLLFGTDLNIWFKIIALVVFLGVVYAYTLKPSQQNDSILVIGAIIVIGLVAMATPLGGPVRSLASSAFGLAQFNTPLDRTIAEQGLAGTDFGSQFGYIAETDQNVLSPLATLFGINTSQNAIFGGITFIFTLLLAVPSLLVNLVLQLGVGLLNLAFNTQVSLNELPFSMMLLWIFIFWVALVYSLWKFFKKEDNLFVLFAATAIPPLIVGIIKIKYTEYAAFMLAIGFGFSMEPVAAMLTTVYAKLTTKKPEHKKKRHEEEQPDELVPHKIYAYILAFGVLMVLLQFTYHGFLPSLVWGSIQPLYQNNPTALASKFTSFCSTSNDSDVCAAASDPLGYASQGTNYQYSDKLCELSVLSNYNYLQYMQNPSAATAADTPPMWEAQAASYRCQRIADYWMNSMEWIANNTESDARITSWWDYGHWINYFGERDTVLRNEHVSHDMIGAVAYEYLDGTPQELKTWMANHDSKYALFDIELISGGGTLGGKYGALNYLACAWINQTTVAQTPGSSQCETDNLWENIFISQNPCTISKLTNKTGYTAYELYAGDTYIPDYPSFCLNPSDSNSINFCNNVLRTIPTYCVGQTTLASGQQAIATYYMNETYPNGDQKLNKAILEFPQQIPTTPQMGPVTEVTLFYTEDPIWLENGQVKSGYEDRKGKFYDSNLYRAIFLNDLPGFTQVYSTPDQAVKIYKVQ